MPMPRQSARRCGQRAGLTLLELLVSMTASTALIAGLSSALFIATRMIEPPQRPNHETAESARECEQLLQELRYITSIESVGENLLDIEVPDRDEDGISEYVRIQWSGVAGESLMWTMNDEPSIPIVNDVHDWQLSTQLADTGEVVSIGMRLQVGSHSVGEVWSTIDLPNRPRIVSN